MAVGLGEGSGRNSGRGGSRVLEGRGGGFDDVVPNRREAV